MIATINRNHGGSGIHSLCSSQQMVFSFVVFIAICSALFIQTNARADDAATSPVTLTASVDKTEVTVGDPIAYRISVVYGKEYHVEFTKPGSNLGQFEIKDYEKKAPAKREDGNFETVISAVIAVYDTGKFDIPPEQVVYWKRPDEKATAVSNKIEINVKSVKGDKAKDIHDIKPPMSVRPSFLRLVILVIVINLFLIALIIGLAILLRRAKAKKAGLPLVTMRKEPQHIIAFNELNAIEAKNLIGQGLIKEYYIEISEVVRRYVGERFTVVTMERTTDEIVSDLIQTRIHRDHIESIGSFLRDADMVKFAKRRPDPQVCGEDMFRARKIIENSMEAPEKDAVLQ